jgi:excisionase family DNA binding protein
MTTTSNEPIAVSVREAAAMIGVTPQHLYNLHAAGQLPGAYRMGRRILVHLETFRDAMAMKAAS